MGQNFGVFDKYEGFVDLVASTYPTNMWQSVIEAFSASETASSGQKEFF